MTRIILSAVFSFWTSVAVASCGGSFSSFVDGLRQEAVSKGHSSASVSKFFKSVRQDPKVIKADRSQGVFNRDFIDFSRRVISKNRMQKGQAQGKKYARIFSQAQRDYGVPPGVILAFWALETDYGAVQGNFNSLNALVTLSHDCRRPELFRPQIFAALELFERGAFDLNTTGAWAGEIGMVQMLPEDIIENGVDGDGDGKVLLKTSVPDALLSGAKMLRNLGWRPNEPWLQEVSVPGEMDWSLAGLTKTLDVSEWQSMGVKPRSGKWQSGGKSSLILPMGRNGPAFIAYPNFNVYFEWNQSFVYVTTAAYFATRLSGAQVFSSGNPDPKLSTNEMKELQKRLSKRGYDVGKIDGILGARTRAAVQKEQSRLGFPADAWPTKRLLAQL